MLVFLKFYFNICYLGKLLHNLTGKISKITSENLNEEVSTWMGVE